MNTIEFNTSELTNGDLQQINGGFFFLFALVPALLAATAEVAVVLTPLAAAAVKGWNDAGK